MPRESSQEKPQVRLDPDVAEWVREVMEDWEESSLSYATNKLLRALRDEPATPTLTRAPPVEEPVPEPDNDELLLATAPIPNHMRRRMPTGISPRAQSILNRNRFDSGR